VFSFLNLSFLFSGIRLELEHDLSIISFWFFDIQVLDSRDRKILKNKTI